MLTIQLFNSFGGGLFSGFGAGAPNSPSFIPFHVTPLLNGTEGEPTEKPFSYQGKVYCLIELSVALVRLLEPFCLQTLTKMSQKLLRKLMKAPKNLF